MSIREQWAKWTKLSPLTNTQSKFLDFIISNRKQVMVLGDMTPIFQDAVQFLKYEKAFVNEYSTKEQLLESINDLKNAECITEIEINEEEIEGLIYLCKQVVKNYETRKIT